MNEEINKLVDILDNFNGMFGCLLSKPESNLLVSYIKQLEHNWNELKKWLEDNITYWKNEEEKWIELGFMKFGGEANNKIIFNKVLSKISELEEVSNE